MGVGCGIIGEREWLNQAPGTRSQSETQEKRRRGQMATEGNVQRIKCNESKKSLKNQIVMLQQTATNQSATRMWGRIMSDEVSATFEDN